MARDGIPAESGGHEMSRRRTSRRDPLGEDMKYVVYDILYQGFSSSGYLTFNFVPPRFSRYSLAMPVQNVTFSILRQSQMRPRPHDTKIRDTKIRDTRIRGFVTPKFVAS